MSGNFNAIAVDKILNFYVNHALYRHCLKGQVISAREEEEGHPGTQSASDHWKIGQARDRGSIHSDIWQGMASELAESNVIAISPRIGWWRERAHLEKWNRLTRYSLIVSITTPEEHIDVYTPVANKVGITVPVEITT